MPLPILLAETPLHVPSKTFDKVWIELIEIHAPSPDRDAVARVRLRRFRTEGGDSELAMEPMHLEVHDLLAKSATDPKLATAVAALMEYIATVGRAEGLIA